MKICIVDYGLGNLRSVRGAIEYLGHEAIISSDISEISSCDKLVLPGVGAFADGIRALKNRKLIEPLTKLVFEDNKKVLGICLGFQLMANDSTEFGHNEGLRWLNASVKKLPPAGLRIPHVGWNNLFIKQSSKIFDSIPENALFYYVHSYHVEALDESLVYGTCLYGSEFTSVIVKDNIVGAQFHPEKSQEWGLQLIKNFIEKF